MKGIKYYSSEPFGMGIPVQKIFLWFSFISRFALVLWQINSDMIGSQKKNMDGGTAYSIRKEDITIGPWIKETWVEP